MQFSELKKLLNDHVFKQGCAFYSYNLLDANLETKKIFTQGSFTCKQEMCSSFLVFPSSRLIFNNIRDIKKLKANLNKIEELLGVPRSVLCFLKDDAATKASLLLSDKSIWASNLFLTDLFCILFRSANLSIDIQKIEDIFNDYNDLSQTKTFQSIVANFPEFLKEALALNVKDFYSRSVYGSYGVLDFYRNEFKCKK